MASIDAETRALIAAAAKAAATAAANKAVGKTFLLLGIDAETPAQVKEAQQDFAWLRRLRLLTTERSGKYWLIVFSTVMGVLGSATTLLIQQLFGG